MINTTILKTTTTVLLILTTTLQLLAQSTIDISGNWNIELDHKNEVVINSSTIQKNKGEIKLPGSLAENGFGLKTTGSDFGILTPEYKYIGKAWYKKEIKIPKCWKNKQVELFLERVLWESRVFIDGKELSKQDALGTPHIHKLGKLLPRKHELTLLIDNEMIQNIGDKGHAYGDYTQSIWNGVIGKMELKAHNNTFFLKTDVYPQITKKQITLKGNISALKTGTAKIEYKIRSINDNKTVLTGKFEQELIKGQTTFNKVISTEGKLKLWSEFNPELYSIRLKLKDGKNKDFQNTEFGFHEVSHDGTKLTVNGKPVFLRGNLDCVHFPKKGYVSCDLDDWIKIFETYKSYGLNHARFHSWCPPEAAFKAANRVGIYLQAEASIWIDWWMSINMKEKGRPEMDTKGYPKGLGLDATRDKFVIDEMNRVVDTYGNHPSFTMFCIGNELGNSDFNIMKTWVNKLKEGDSRRLYSVSTARTITEVDDYLATHYIKGLGRTRGLNGAHTNWNFEDIYSQMNIPIIAHEIGQWPVYPRWSEIDKYTGVLKARNFKEFKLQAEKNGIVNQDNDFADASGALNQIMYKYEIESFLRTKSCAGIQLLSMQDYQGQGEALIGWLDSHWESKNITTPKQFKKHFNTTVPLLLMDKYVWENNEIFTAKMQISHHGSVDLNTKTTWKIHDENGNILKKGEFTNQNFKVGTLNDIGQINFDLSEIKTAKKLFISIQIPNTEFENEWPIWVYPKQEVTPSIKDLIITNKLDATILNKLKNGAKVLLQANELGDDKNSVKALFYPLYWSLTFFPGQGKTNIGLLLNDKHSAFNKFPTSTHSNWQWESISNNAKGFILNDLPHTYKAIAQPVDDFHRNNKVGSIFELKVGEGKLLVCGYDLTANKPVAKQLKTSLLNYMNSESFSPTQTVTDSWLNKVLKYIPKAKKASLPKKLENAILYIEAAANIKEEKKKTAWNNEIDNVLVAKKANYTIKSNNCWKEEEHSVWYGNEMELTINCPEGMLGTVLINFSDYNKKKRNGNLNFEGRKSKITTQPINDNWVKFHVMREDSNDGKLILKTISTSKNNLMIKDVILLKE